MLGNLLKAFFVTNMASAGASKVLGPQNIISTGIGSITDSFLSVGSPSSGGGGGFKMVEKMTNPKKFQTSIRTGNSSAAKLASAGNSRFPTGTNRLIKLGMADYRMGRLIQDVNIRSVSNKTLKLDDYEDYKTKEETISVSTA